MRYQCVCCGEIFEQENIAEWCPLCKSEMVRLLPPVPTDSNLINPNEEGVV